MFQRGDLAALGHIIQTDLILSTKVHKGPLHGSLKGPISWLSDLFASSAKKDTCKSSVGFNNLPGFDSDTPWSFIITDKGHHTCNPSDFKWSVLGGTCVYHCPRVVLGMHGQ